MRIKARGRDAGSSVINGSKYSFMRVNLLEISVIKRLRNSNNLRLS